MSSHHGIYRRLAFCLLSASLLVANAESQTSRATQPGTVSATTPASPRVPAGLTFTVRLTDSLNSQTASAGQGWAGILVNDMVGPGGKVFALSGATVAGVVAAVQPPTDTTSASISLRAVSLNGVDMQTESVTRSKKPAGETISTPSGKVSVPAGFSAATRRGFAASTAPGGQTTLAAGAILSFTTTVP